MSKHWQFTTCVAKKGECINGIIKDFSIFLCGHCNLATQIEDWRRCPSDTHSVLISLGMLQVHPSLCNFQGGDVCLTYLLAFAVQFSIPIVFAHFSKLFYFWAPFLVVLNGSLSFFLKFKLLLTFPVTEFLGVEVSASLVARFMVSPIIRSTSLSELAAWTLSLSSSSLADGLWALFWLVSFAVSNLPSFSVSAGGGGVAHRLVGNCVMNLMFWSILNKVWSRDGLLPAGFCFSSGWETFVFDWGRASSVVEDSEATLSKEVFY